MNKIKDILKNNRIALKIGPVKRTSQVDYILVSQFARSTRWRIGIGVCLLPFIYAEVEVFEMARKAWQKSNELSYLVDALFSTSWLIGWSLGLGLMLIIFTLMMLGRQVLLVHSGKVDSIFGIPGFGVRVRLAASEIHEVLLIEPNDTSIFPKQGRQLQIITNKENDDLPFGSNHTELDLQRLQQAIKRNRDIVTNLNNISEHKAMNASDIENDTSKPVDVSEPNLMSWNSPSTMALIVANLVPLIGNAFFNWDLGATMVLYWAETAIVLLYTVLKQITLDPIYGFFTSLFTIAHVGGFMAVHFLFIWLLFVQSEPGFTGRTQMTEVFNFIANLWPALLALLISHGYSFKTIFLDRKNRRQKKQTDRDFYSRIGLMHVTIIFGGGAALFMGSGLFAIALLVFLKIMIDVKTHIKLHSG